MPELPEVETICRGIQAKLIHQKIVKVVIRNSQLRWPIPKNLPELIQSQTIQNISRRAKYLLFQFDNGHLVIHLGMSGGLQLLQAPINKPNLHDHVDIIFSNNFLLRYRDPRRFGAILWITEPIEQHPLFKHLGPEPLTAEFNAHYLFSKIQKRNIAIKLAIMNNHIVVGIGNIYATEALFDASIHPNRPANTLILEDCQQLVKSCKLILRKAIKAGGTSLKDFYHSDGGLGNFHIELNVYGKAGSACLQCGNQLERMQLGQRTTTYCPNCQI